jgi:hypothetical protein
MTAAPPRSAPGAGTGTGFGLGGAGSDLAGDAGSDLAGDAGQSREWPLPFALDIALALSVHRRGPGDPAYARDAAGAIWRTSLTPDGPGTLRVTSRRLPASGPPPAAGMPSATGTPSAAGMPPPIGATPATGPVWVTGRAWGAGAGWLLDNLPGWLGFHDDRAGFAPRHPVVSDLALRYDSFRVGRSGRVFEALVPAVLEQKVVTLEAHRAWRFLLVKYGEPAPGPAPAGMRVPPAPRTWARIPSWDWHRAGVEGVRARTIITAAAVASRLEEAAELDPAEADRRLRALPGIGVWTSAEIRQRAMGDPDAVSVGDYHLPNAVGWTLARRKTDDAGMLELLAPYAGHRYRVTRLIELGGTRPERHGPRMSVRDYRAF